MKFDVVGLNRIVELDDEIVAEYCRYKPLSEDPFVIVAISEYGHEPTAQEVSDEELSKLCNEVLLSDLKALALLPNALAAFKTVTDGGVPMALSIGGDLLMRMTWEEIVKAYPKQYVALVDVYPDIYKLESAVVVHSEKDMSESDMFKGAMDGKWLVKGTSVDADFNMGTQFA